MAYLDEMNVKANEQDTVGTDYDLRDKDLNAATAKTSVASTDGVVLKGTDGSYHTIDRSSFTEAVRSVIGGILNNMASKGTAVKGVSVIDNSNDFGLTTPSDLASVLGAPFPKGELVTDANDITRAGCWALESVASNVKYLQGILIHFETNRGTFPRLQLNISQNGELAVRIYKGGGWTSWVEHN